MADIEELERRIVDLEMLLARQERLSDDLSSEILRLNRLHEAATARLDAFERRMAEEAAVRPIAEEPPPPHY